MRKWEMVKLGDVAKLYQPQTISQVDFVENAEFHVFGANGIIGRYTQYNHKNSELIVTCRGATCGNVHITPPKCWITGNAMVISPKTTSKIYQLFLFFALRGVSLSLAITGAAQPQITRTNLEKIKIPLPPLEEQKKIAQELGNIQSLITKRKQQLDKMDLLVKAKFVEMFGDPVANPVGWAVKSLKQTTTITTGNTPPKNDIENYGNHIEWIKTDNITENMFLTTATEYLSEKGAKKGRVVEKNTILMACIAGSIKSIGRVAITDRNVSFNQQINAITPKKSIYNIYFLYYLCIFTQKYIQSNISMSLKGILSKGRLEQIKFVTPPIELQSQFSDYVQQTETLKTTMHSGLEKLELLYNSKMQEYFG